ncbi:MAG: hypothetical protein ABI840_07830 [bacterium]
MRNSSNELFNLIKSLSKSEKGYFKKFSALHTIGKENKYLKLFILIVKQKIYDEKKIKKAFKGDGFVKQLPVAKNYLYKIILKSLNQYYSDSTISIKINNLFNASMILYRKGLLNESLKLLLKGKMLAYKYEKYESLIQILNLEKQITIGLQPRDYLDKLIGNSVEKTKVSKRISNIVTFDYDLNKVVVLYNSRRIIRNTEDSKAYDKIMNKPRSRDERYAEEFESKLYFYHKLVNYNLAAADDIKAYDYVKKLARVLESNSEHIKEFTHEYVSVLNTCLVTILFLKKYDESDNIIKKLNSLKPLSLILQNRIRTITLNFMLNKSIKTGEFEMCLKIIPQIEDQLKLMPYESRKFHEEKINYSLSYIYLGLDNYEKALEYINKILDDRYGSTRIDLLSFAHILNLIIHYELDSNELLPYIIKNTSRFLAGKKELYHVEREILNFFKTAPDLLTKKQRIDAFSDLRKKIINITKDPYERIALDYFDFISWVESKIAGKKFSDIVKAKAN